MTLLEKMNILLNAAGYKYFEKYPPLENGDAGIKVRLSTCSYGSGLDVEDDHVDFLLSLEKRYPFGEVKVQTIIKRYTIKEMIAEKFVFFNLGVMEFMTEKEFELFVKLN
jgi:hypothetical protein